MARRRDPERARTDLVRLPHRRVGQRVHGRHRRRGRRLRRPAITYRRLERNIDLNAHYNLCYEGCETEYVCALPDDDRFAPDFLERTVPVLDANPRVGVVHSQVTVIDREGSVIAPAHDMTGLPRDAIESGLDFIRASFDGSYRVHATTTLIRT